MQPEDPERHTAFGLFVGDQIYADATAGLVDPLSPTERYAERHRNALKRSTDQWNPALGELLANLPVVMTPDDHEYNDNYPAGSPLVPARTAERVSEVQGVAKAAAHDAWRFFQSSSGGVGKKGWASFDSGPLRVLVLDTRSNRQLPQCTTFSDHQRHKISTWLDHEDAAKSLNLIATGSVVLPGLKSDADPANPGASDTFQWSPLDSEWLLTTLAKACMKNPQHFRFALLSGDYHVSMMSQLKLDDRVVGVSIVVPPVYAPIPYVNATAQSVWFSESIPVTLASGNTSVWTIESLSPKSKNAETSTPVLTGSAIAEITVTRTTNTPALPYKIEWQADLLNYEQGSPIDTVKICTRI
jgi:phosphodiesterase/alkaline phosphatase D-like protein